MYENMHAQIEVWTHQRLNQMHQQIAIDNQLDRQRMAVLMAAWWRLMRKLGRELIQIGSWLTKVGTYQMETRN